MWTPAEQPHLAADARSYFDGQAWRHLSPDGHYFWSGERWTPLPDGARAAAVAAAAKRPVAIESRPLGAAASPRQAMPVAAPRPAATAPVATAVPAPAAVFAPAAPPVPAPAPVFAPAPPAVSTVGAAQPFGPPPGPVLARRPPSPAECELCGHAPAARLRLHRHTGLVLAFRFTGRTGTYCRDCGRAELRAANDSTLVRGWWGVVSALLVAVTLLLNARAWARIRRLAPPQRVPGVVAPRPMPAGVGRPVVRRAGALVTVMVLSLAAVAAYLVR